MFWSRLSSCLIVSCFGVFLASGVSAQEGATLETSLDTLPAEPMYQTEILAIGNVAQNDSNYLSLSVRQSLSGNLDDGLKIRGDINRTAYGYNVNALEIDGEIISASEARELRIVSEVHLWAEGALEQRVVG